LAVVYHDLEQSELALQAAQRTYRILMDHPLYGAMHPKTKQCLGYLQSAGQFTLQDLQGSLIAPVAPVALEAVALNACSGTLFNQKQPQVKPVEVAKSLEKKLEPGDKAKQNCVLC
jgi:hypothetical protein